MGAEEKKGKSEFESRSAKIFALFKDPYFVGLVGLIILAFAIRVYYFTKTLDQAVWWDEGEYMLRVKHLVLGTPQSGFFQGRELFTPYFWAVIYYLFNSETAIRFVQVIISTLTVVVTYFLGKEIYDKKIGLLAAAFMGFSWLHLFFTARLLTYLYPPLFYTLAIALFWKGYHSDSPKDERYLLLSFLTITIGLGIYFTITLAAVTILIYLLVTEGFKFLKSKKLWKNFLISLPFLLLSFIPSYFVQGSIVPRLGQAATIVSTEIGAGLRGLILYAQMMPRLMLTIWMVLLIASFIVFIRMFLFFDFVLKKKEGIMEFRKDFYIFVSLLVPWAFYTWIASIAGGPQGATYDAYIMVLFPVIFVFMSRFLSYLTIYIKKVISSEKIVWLLVILVVLVGAYSQIQFADESIKAKEPSFHNLKPAGEWLKENTAKEDKIYSAAVPELTYYSEREILGHDDPMVNKSEEGFIKFINMEKPKYLVLTVWEYSPAYAMNPIQNGKFNLTVANAYFIEMNGQKNPDVVIYEAHY